MSQTVKLSLVKGRRREDRVLHTFNVDVRWSKPTGENASVGLEFHQPNALDRRAQALLMFPNSEALARYRANRLQDIKVSQGTWTFMKWSMVQTLRGLKMATAEIKKNAEQRFAPAKVAAPVVATVKVESAATAPAITAQTVHTALAASPAAQTQQSTQQRAIPSMPSVAMPHIPVSPFATGGQATMVPATPMVQAAQRQSIPTPSLAPQAHELAHHSADLERPFASSLPVARQVPVSRPIATPQQGRALQAAAPSREVPL